MDKQKIPCCFVVRTKLWKVERMLSTAVLAQEALNDKIDSEDKEIRGELKELRIMGYRWIRNRRRSLTKYFVDVGSWQ